MRLITRDLFLATVAVTALTLGGCASVASVEKAQATADAAGATAQQALQTAQQAQQAAAAAQQTADQAKADVAGLSQRVDALHARGARD